ncbi:hypothetical protein ACFWOB_14590 [Streptomyces sp. NPDC058420]|uniref:DinB/UmuC family translesion DNA polymerase n=1 Tax=Streptomyces sp. NPDC058420 TaxID=3346489 RepID=UPI003664680E
MAVDRARGIDPRTVTPRLQPASATVRHRFARDVHDGAAARAALLGLVVQLGAELRRRDQGARALTLTLSFAGGPTWEKTRRLTGPSAHEDDLRLLAYQVMEAAGLQRGRLTGLALRAEDLVDVGLVAEQLSLDAARQARLVVESAADRIRARFGPGRSGRPPRTGPPPDATLARPAARTSHAAGKSATRRRFGTGPTPTSTTSAAQPSERPLPTERTAEPLGAPSKQDVVLEASGSVGRAPPGAGDPSGTVPSAASSRTSRRGSGRSPGGVSGRAFDPSGPTAPVPEKAVPDRVPIEAPSAGSTGASFLSMRASLAGILSPVFSLTA